VLINNILIDCVATKGLVHKVTGVLYNHDLNVLSNREFIEPETGRFFMRTEIAGALSKECVYNGLQDILPPQAKIQISEKRRKKAVILVTKEHHCLGELLIRHHFGELDAEIVAVIGNHEVLETLTTQFNIPFFFMPHENRDRATHEAEIQAQIDPFQPDFIILAKYMRVLTADFVNHYAGRIVNIHHSFLPAFIGASPYRQAHARGVKITGATAHFVTSDLDQGPIIMQQVMPTDHTHSPQEMAQMGRDIEKITLARALKLVFEDRVFVSGNRTIIFD
jgi:formyltetrahydrofolate deformylase